MDVVLVIKLVLPVAGRPGDVLPISGAILLDTLLEIITIVGFVDGIAALIGKEGVGVPEFGDAEEALGVRPDIEVFWDGRQIAVRISD